MTEEDAKGRVRTELGEAGTERLARLAEMVLAENERQNLIAQSTVPLIWSRHILDSVQLLALAGDVAGEWLDVGTGGGFPGLVIAAASCWRTVLVEPRRRRAEFLARAAEELGLSNVIVSPAMVERCAGATVSIISARAVAPIEELFDVAGHRAGPNTCWLLPRGSRYESDLATARSRWQGVFHVEQSISDPNAGIVVASRVMRK